MLREPYNPKTLLQLLVHLQSYASDRNPAAFNFMDAKDSIFRALHHVLNNHSKKLLHDGIGTKKKRRELLQWKRRNFVGKQSNENTFANGFTKCSIIFILESTV